MVPVGTTGVEEAVLVGGLPVAGLAVASEQGTDTKMRGKSKRGHPKREEKLKIASEF